jgi:hypothetical protein
VKNDRALNFPIVPHTSLVRKRLVVAIARKVAHGPRRIILLARTVQSKQESAWPSYSTSNFSGHWRSLVVELQKYIVLLLSPKQTRARCPNSGHRSERRPILSGTPLNQSTSLLVRPSYLYPSHMNGSLPHQLKNLYLFAMVFVVQRDLILDHTETAKISPDSALFGSAIQEKAHGPHRPNCLNSSLLS